MAAVAGAGSSTIPDGYETDISQKPTRRQILLASGRIDEAMFRALENQPTQENEQYAQAFTSAAELGGLIYYLSGMPDTGGDMQWGEKHAYDNPTLLIAADAYYKASQEAKKHFSNALSQALFGWNGFITTNRPNIDNTNLEAVIAHFVSTERTKNTSDVSMQARIINTIQTRGALLGIEGFDAGLLHGRLVCVADNGTTGVGGVAELGALVLSGAPKSRVDRAEFIDVIRGLTDKAREMVDRDGVDPSEVVSMLADELEASGASSLPRDQIRSFAAPQVFALAMRTPALSRHVAERRPPSLHEEVGHTGAADERVRVRTSLPHTPVINRLFDAARRRRVQGASGAEIFSFLVRELKRSAVHFPNEGFTAQEMLKHMLLCEADLGVTTPRRIDPSKLSNVQKSELLQVIFPTVKSDARRAENSGRPKEYLPERVCSISCIASNPDRPSETNGIFIGTIDHLTAGATPSVQRETDKKLSKLKVDMLCDEIREGDSSITEGDALKRALGLVQMSRHDYDSVRGEFLNWTRMAGKDLAPGDDVVRYHQQTATDNLNVSKNRRKITTVVRLHATDPQNPGQDITEKTVQRMPGAFPADGFEHWDVKKGEARSGDDKSQKTALLEIMNAFSGIKVLPDEVRLRKLSRTERPYGPNFMYEDDQLDLALTRDQAEALLEEMFADVDEALLNGESALFHCMEGISRSSTMAAAYLMKRFGLTADQAVLFLQSKRSIVQPNSKCYMQFLKEYERLLTDMGYITVGDEGSADVRLSRALHGGAASGGAAGTHRT